MIELTEWLMSIEHLANKFYTSAADSFGADPSLRKFLQHLADDEADHYHIMSSAVQYLRSQPARSPRIIVDTSLMNKIETPIREGLRQIQGKNFCKEEILALTIKSERSEWNDLFYYVLNTLKEEDRIFESAANRIDHHLRYVEHYLRSIEYGQERLTELLHIPYAKKLKTLIVDDERPIATLLTQVLDDICEPIVASNGQEALEKIKGNSFDLVISDVDMPLIDGFELYQQASTYFDRPQDAFLFHTGGLTEESRRFFTENNLDFIQKPSSIMEIRQMVKDKTNLNVLSE